MKKIPESDVPEAELSGSKRERVQAVTKSIPYRRGLTSLALACILASFCIAVIRLHPTNFFGYTEDDSIYFSSAKGLAEGKGYVLASFPGTPAATKYPVLYPWVLSWVWRWNPSFPSNLIDAIGVTIAFGILYIAVAFLFLRRFNNISDIEALILTAFCALHPLVVFYGGSILSEIPFAALALASMLLAQKAMQPAARPTLAVCCGILAGLSILTRAFGVPVAAGIAVAAVAHRAWRPLLAFAASVCPFFAVICAETIASRRIAPPVSGLAASSLGWVHTLAYYTSYPNVWRMGVPTVAIFFTMLRTNALVLLGAPAAYFLFPLLQGQTIVGTAVIVLVTAAVLGGMLRDARQNGFKPVHFVLPLYAGLIVVWSYPHASRFLIPFLPLFAAGLWLEAKRLLTMIRGAIRLKKPMPERVIAVVFSILLMGLVCILLANCFRQGQSLIEASRKRASLLQEKREAYDWLARSSGPRARVVAYEDGSLYLYTGRQSARPFTFTTAEFYDPPRLDSDLDHFTDVARAIGAQYWVSADDDFGYEWADASRKAHARMRTLEQVLPVVFRTRQDRVKVYCLACLQHPEAASCKSAASLLFPAGDQQPSVEPVLR
ncbi:MAG: hypothetical protein ABSA57_07460 [Candidatus Acidiferrales bacterium]